MRSLHSNREMVTSSRRPFGQLGCAEGETFATEATPASSFGSVGPAWPPEKFVCEGVGPALENDLL